jgi:hypothetical protein
MTLEVALISLGTNITKAVIKTLMPGQDVADAPAGTVITLFKADNDGIVAERKATRAIDEMGERIAESLASTFEAKGKTLIEGSREAVAVAVSDCIAAAHFSPDVLADIDLSPSRVLHRLQVLGSERSQQFNDAENNLLIAVLQEASQQIVDIASKLSLFTERTFVEILRRQSQMKTAVDEVVAKIEAIRTPTSSIAVDGSIINSVVINGDNNLVNGVIDQRKIYAQFEEDYRRAVARNLDILEIFGANVSNANRRYRLSVAYIALEIDKCNVGNKLKEPLGDEEIAPATISKPRYGIMPVEQCLATSKRLLIRGVAGSGKTTLLQWIAVKAANKAFLGTLVDWNDTIPFFIRLRACINGPLTAPKDFPNLVTPAIAGKMPEGWVESQLDAGRALILVDGVDEVSIDRQQAVREWLRDLDSDYGSKNRIVVTGRTHIENDWLQHEEFDSAEAVGMDLGRIRQFIDYWHASVGLDLHDDDEIIRLRGDCEHLQSVVAVPGPVRKLATNPLLCALICALHRERQRYLPKDRIQLYRECIQVLLERRDKVRGVDAYNLTLRQQEQILQELAYYMVLNGWSAVPWSAAVDRLQPKLLTLNLLPNLTAENVLRQLVERSGIIREPVKGEIDFVHRTFEDFLAAQAAVYARDIGLVVSKAEDPGWREVIILAVGLASDRNQSDCADILRGLYVRGDDVPNVKSRPRLYLLAAAALETVVSVDPDLRAEVENRVAKLLPPMTEDGAKALAVAGDLAVPHLLTCLEEETLAPKIRQLCGNALSYIGDPRPGVGLRPNGVPDIAWCDVPSGEFQYGGADGAYEPHQGQRIFVPAFRIAKYPVTYVQFQAFIDDGGYQDERWWQQLIRPLSPGKQTFNFTNRPRENLSWYDAMAFCKWLSNKLGYEVRLPTEQEWERAARGMDARAYPWGNEFEITRANTGEGGIRQTTCVGIYPSGKSPYGAIDVSGNVWELCLNKWDEKASVLLREQRVIRGGCWHSRAKMCHSAYRSGCVPGGRANDQGFRLFAGPE